MPTKPWADPPSGVGENGMWVSGGSRWFERVLWCQTARRLPRLMDVRCGRRRQDRVQPQDPRSSRLARARARQGNVDRAQHGGCGGMKHHGCMVASCQAQEKVPSRTLTIRVRGVSHLIVVQSGARMWQTEMASLFSELLMD